VLREHPWNETSPILGSFKPFDGYRIELGYTVNPYLVILAAEIKFRRYVAANGPPLLPVYNSLMQKTIEVAELLYFRPEMSQPALPSSLKYIPVDMEGYHAPAPLHNGKISCTGASGSSGGCQQRPVTGGGGARREDANYWRDMLSGRDLEMNNDDLDLLSEIEESNRAASSHGQSFGQVETWRQSIEEEQGDQG